MEKESVRTKKLTVEVKASIAYTLCNIVQRSLIVLTMPLFTRVLSQAEYGQGSVYNSWRAILMIFITLNLSYGSFDAAMVKFEKHRDEYIASVNFICTMLGCVFLIVYIPFQSMWNKVFGLPSILIFVMVLECVMSSATLFWTGKQKYDYKYKEVVCVTLILAVMSTLVSLMLVFMFQDKGIGKIVGNASVVILTGAFFYFYSFYKGKCIVKMEYCKYALSFNIPLIAYYLSQTVFNQSDRIMIDYFNGKDKAAIYSVGYSLAFMLNTVLNSINGAYVPWLYRKLKVNKGEDNKKISMCISLLMVVILLMVILVAPEIVYIFAGEAYEGAKWVVPPVAMSILLLFYAQLFIDIEFYFEEKSLLVRATIGAALANIILNAVLIPYVGYYAAAYTTLISYIFFALGNYFAYKKTRKKHYIEGEIFDIKQMIKLCLVFFLLSFFIMTLYEFPVIRYLIIVMVLVCGIIFRRKLIQIYFIIRG